MSANAIVNGKVYPLGKATTYAHSKVAVGATSGLVLAANAARVTLTIQNISTMDIYLNLVGAAAVVDACFKLASGATMSMNITDFDLTRTAIYGIRGADVGTHYVIVSEGTV